MAIPVLIIEDNPSAVSSLKALLMENPALEILDSARTLADADAIIERTHPSLLFIDVEMPDGNGIEYWESLRKHASWNIYAIFYTAFDKYAISALRAKAHDFLLKPVIKADVDNALQRFFLHCADHFANNDSLNKNITEDKDNTPLLVLDHMNCRVTLRSSEIGYFKYVAERKVWEVYCTNGKKYVLRHGVNSAKILSVCNDFEQVHKSYIINLAFLDRIEDNNLILLPPFDNSINLQVTRMYRNALFEHFLQL